MVDQPQSEESGVSKPTYTTEETAKAFTTLLNNETASNEQLEPKTKENNDIEPQEEVTDELFESVDGDNIEDNTEATSKAQEELYKVKIGDQELEVTLDEALKGYQRESDYTKKTQDLGNQRREIETQQDSLKKELEAVKNSRSQYEQQLTELTKHLNQDSNIDWETLYRENPADYIKLKADDDKRKETLQLAQLEQQRINEEKRKEQEKVYNNYLVKERQILAEKMPVYADKEKGPQLLEKLTNFALEQGYTQKEISMMVDHRSVLLLADAYRYNQIKKTKLANKKVKTTPRNITSNASNVREDSEEKQNVEKRMSRLKQSGHLKDAQSVLKQMYFNE
jgi:intracellular sulfur oxidation DsrE/DsrF family protein